MEVDVKHIAKLAKLKIPEGKIDGFATEMAAIIKMVEHLPDIESSGALLDADDTMQLREDVVRPSAPREEILQNAPETANGCFMVPKTVE